MEATIKSLSTNSLNNYETQSQEMQPSETFSTFFSEVPSVTVEFLTTFIVNARGGIMCARRQKGLCVLIPKNACVQPTYLAVHWIQPHCIQNLPILMDGEVLISPILQISPIKANFLRPIVFVIPHFGLLNENESEIVILRSDNGKIWSEHGLNETNCNAKEVLNSNFINQLKYTKKLQTNSFVCIATRTLPHLFAVISRFRQDITSIDSRGGIVSSQLVPQVEIIFQPETVNRKILIGLQVRPFNLGEWVSLNRVVVSPIITVEPRCRKFRKPITVRLPFPQINFHFNNFNHYIGNTSNVRLLCSMSSCHNLTTWKDVTGSTLLSYENNLVTFTTKISGRYWLIDCKDNADVNNIALKLYERMMRIPFLANIIVYAKRISPKEAKFSIHCLLKHNEQNILEYGFHKIATSSDIKLFDNQQINIKFDNFIPIVRYNKKLSFRFKAFQNNNLRFAVNILNPNNIDDCASFRNVDTIFKEIICTLDISLR